jgi:hypothetical protein
LAPIPIAWAGGYYLNVPEYVFIDQNVTYNGNPSLRLQSGGGVDPWDSDRSAWTTIGFGDAYQWWEGKISVKPGDHIVTLAWMKTDPSSTGDTIQGARIGVDFYGKGIILDGYPGLFITDGSEYVHWGTSTWTMKQYDFIVPSTVYETDQTGKPIVPTAIDAIVMWVQARPANDSGSIWIADSQLYINP